MAVEVGHLTKRHQEEKEASDPMNLRLFWRLSASSTPPYVSATRPTPERYVLLVLADGYQRPEPFDDALRRIVKGVSEDVGLEELIDSTKQTVYRDLQIWSLYYPEFTDLAARPGPPSSTFLERYFSELHMLTSPNIYPRTNELRRAIKNQHGIHVDKVLVLANVTERGAGHTGGCLVVAGEYAASYRLFLHEMGHAIGLGDEYSWEGVEIPGPPGRDDYPYPNVSKFQRVKDRKDFLHEGAMYTTKAFRRAKDCIMRDAEYGLDDKKSGWESFCEVCQDQFRKFFILRQGAPDKPKPPSAGAIVETVVDRGPFPLIPENQKTFWKRKEEKAEEEAANTASAAAPISAAVPAPKNTNTGESSEVTEQPSGHNSQS